MATTNNLYIDQGTTYTANIQVFDSTGAIFNLTGYTANAQIRRNYATNTVSATFTACAAANGTVTLALSRDDTGNLKYGRYVYDVEITSGNTTLRAAEGIVVVNPQVTR